MTIIPNNFYRYKQMPLWNEKTIAKWVLWIHNTKAWLYGKINLVSWALEYFLYDENDEIYKKTILSPGNPGIALPQQNHSVKPVWKIEMYIDFYKEKPEKLHLQEQKFIKKYWKNPHFEVIELLDIIPNLEEKTVADICCGWWRNGLFLAENWALKTTFFDKNRETLETIQNLWNVNNLNIETQEIDFNKGHIDWNYDIIINTVSLQFLQKKEALRIIAEMQKSTNLWWYNLIIAPILSEDVPCKIDFPFLAEQNEIKELYKNWEIIEYNEMIWEFHRVDENWVKVKSRFATIIARKI